MLILSKHLILVSAPRNPASNDFLPLISAWVARTPALVSKSRGKHGICEPSQIYLLPPWEKSLTSRARDTMYMMFPDFGSVEDKPSQDPLFRLLELRLLDLSVTYHGTERDPLRDVNKSLQGGEMQLMRSWHQIQPYQFERKYNTLRDCRRKATLPSTEQTFQHTRFFYRNHSVSLRFPCTMQSNSLSHGWLYDFCAAQLTFAPRCHGTGERGRPHLPRLASPNSISSPFLPAFSFPRLHALSSPWPCTCLSRPD